jgi:hypothetical protein
VLSVVLAQLEALKLTATGGVRRTVGWCLLGISAFNGLLEPFFSSTFMPHHLGMIGVAILAVSYGWQGATKAAPVARRQSDAQHR